MIQITNKICIPHTEIELIAIRAQGAGGQHVNKVSTAIHLRFNIVLSSLPEDYKTRLLNTRDYRITTEGIIVIKAQSYRSQEQNKLDALERLRMLIKTAITIPKKRTKTRPSKGSVKRRLDQKTQRGAVKQLRRLPPQ